MHLRRVVEGERVQGAVVVAVLQGLDTARVVGDERPVRERRALRGGGGPGGVQDLRGVPFLELDVGLVGVVPAQRHAQDVEAVTVQQGAVYRGTGPAAHRVHVLPERRGVEERLRAGLVEDVEKLVPGEGEVDGDVDQAGPHAPQPEQDIGVGVRAVGGYPVALLQAPRQQRVGDAVGPRVELGVAPAALLEDDGVLPWVAPGGSPESVSDGVPASARHHPVYLLHRRPPPRGGRPRESTLRLPS